PRPRRRSSSARSCQTSFRSDSPSSRNDCAQPASLEALDTAAARNKSLHAGVRGMTARTHLEHELVAHGAGGELVPARATTHVGRNEVGVGPLHFVTPLVAPARHAATPLRADQPPGTRFFPAPVVRTNGPPFAFLCQTRPPDTARPPSASS